MEMKVCSKCKINKPFSDYFRDNKRKIGIRCKCKDCEALDIKAWREKNRSEYNSYAAMWRAKNPGRQHATEIKRRYKMSVEDYNAHLTKQGCKCKICGKQHDPSISRGRLYVDHDHKTGKFRGLICSLCNTGLGYLERDSERIDKAKAYLEETLE